MTERGREELIHKVNNLLAVIVTQSTLARTAGTLDAFESAIAQIEKTALATRELVQRARNDGEEPSP
jgi:two-component sensor histidine kinase